MINENVIRNIENMWSEVKEASVLKKQAEDLIEDILPYKWEDGDIRYVSSDLFFQLVTIGEKLNRLTYGSEYERLAANGVPQNKVTYRGQFGTITIKDVKDKP